MLKFFGICFLISFVIIVLAKLPIVVISKSHLAELEERDYNEGFNARAQQGNQDLESCTAYVAAKGCR